MGKIGLQKFRTGAILKAVRKYGKACARVREFSF